MRQRPFERGDIIRVTQAYKSEFRDPTSRATKTWSCHVTLVEYGKDHRSRKGWWFDFVPCHEPDTIQCGFGHNFFADEPGEWGIQSVEVIGHSRIACVEITHPKPGDRAYDLMC